MKIRMSSYKQWVPKNATLDKLSRVMASIAILLGIVTALLVTPGASASEPQPACTDSFHFFDEARRQCLLIANGSPFLIEGSVTAPALTRSDIIPFRLQYAHVSVFLVAPAPFYTVASCSQESGLVAECWSSGSAVPAGTILGCNTWVWAARTIGTPAAGVASFSCSNAGAGGGGEVTNQPPNASFTVSCSGRNCTFDGSGSTDPDGEIASHSWEFGDGGSGGGSVVTHTFPATAASYTVSLTASDNDGATDTEKKTVSCSKRGQKITCS